MIAIRSAPRPSGGVIDAPDAPGCPPYIQEALTALTEHIVCAAGATAANLSLTTDEGEPVLLLASAAKPASALVPANDAASAHGKPGRPSAAIDIPLQSPVPAHRLVLTAFLTEGDSAPDHAAAGNRARAIAPLIDQLVQAWMGCLAETRRATQLCAMLDMVDTAMILVDHHQHILQCNRRAALLLNAGDGLRQMCESVTATDLNCALRLQIAIAHVLEGRGGTAPVIAVRRKHSLRPLLIAVTPLQQTEETAAMLTIFDPARDMQDAIVPASKYYGLSPVEARLAALLVQGATLSEAASSLRIREPTARTYLKQIFSKTDVRRQSELVRLLVASSVCLPAGQPLELV